MIGGKGGTRSDVWMGRNRLLYLHGTDDLSTAVDNLLGPARDVEVPILVEKTEIAWEKNKGSKGEGQLL